MMKRITLALTVAALMAGCSSGVKLDDVPVEDKNATSTMGGANNGANSGNTSQSGVAGVDLGQSGRDGAGPVGVARGTPAAPDRRPALAPRAILPAVRRSASCARHEPEVRPKRSAGFAPREPS